MNNNNNRSNSSNNSNNNNRRRGRNNNNNRGSGGGGGGAVQGNRIDSRARGNAPQMLEKYRKLAHDASLNDDRVLTEYYLQFADHYFRVMADMKAQKDEQQLRGGGRIERGPEDDGDFGPEDEFEARTRQYQPQNQNNHQNNYQGNSQQGNAQGNQQPQRTYRDDAGIVSEGVEGEPDDGANPFTPERRPERARRPERNEPRAPRAERPERTERPEGGERQERPARAERAERPERTERPARAERSEPSEAREPVEAREPRAPRKAPVRRAQPRDDQPRDDDDSAAPALLDASILPPAIARADAELDLDHDDTPVVRKPLRVRTKRPPTDDTDETLEAVG